CHFLQSKDISVRPSETAGMAADLQPDPQRAPCSGHRRMAARMTEPLSRGLAKARICQNRHGKAGRELMRRQLHLNLFINSRGHHEASWRHPRSSPLALSDVRYFQELARKAEVGLFDSIFLADQLALADDIASAPRTWLEPITALGALAVSTSHIGLI